MDKLSAVKEKYLGKGVKQHNIDYAIKLVKNGTKRPHILESLQEEHRGMTYDDALTLLEDLYLANGGEFKVENKGGYLYVIVCLLVGTGCTFYLIHYLIYGGILYRPITIMIGAFGGIFGGFYLLYKTMKGTFREDENPFNKIRL